MSELKQIKFYSINEKRPKKGQVILILITTPEGGMIWEQIKWMSLEEAFMKREITYKNNLFRKEAFYYVKLYNEFYRINGWCCLPYYIRTFPRLYDSIFENKENSIIEYPSYNKKVKVIINGQIPYLERIKI